MKPAAGMRRQRPGSQMKSGSASSITNMVAVDRTWARAGR